MSPVGSSPTGSKLTVNIRVGGSAFPSSDRFVPLPEMRGTYRVSDRFDASTPDTTACPPSGKMVMRAMWECGGGENRLPWTAEDVGDYLVRNNRDGRSNKNLKKYFSMSHGHPGHAVHGFKTYYHTLSRAQPSRIVYSPNDNGTWTETSTQILG